MMKLKTKDSAALLGLLALLAMMGASLVGVFNPNIYHLEAAAWSAQAIGQDWVNVLLVFPLGLWIWYQAWRGSWRYFLVWLGCLLYIVYSYLLYSFFIHFGVAFPLYILALSSAFYALVVNLGCIDFKALAKSGVKYLDGRWQAVWLASISGIFFSMWLIDIAQAWLHHRLPSGALLNGLIVNPVEVLDLALLLPAFWWTATQVKHKRAEAYVWLPICLTFSIVMSVAIVGMMLKLKWSLISSGYGPMPFMLLTILISAVALFDYLRVFKKFS